MKTTKTLALAVTCIFVACNSGTPDKKNNVVGLDTTVTYKNNVLADTAQPVIAPAGTVTKKVVETRSPDGSVTTTTTTTVPPKSSSVPRANRSRVASPHTAAVNTPQPATTTVRKKGWSNRAKGAAIGGVGGAVVGAAVSKKKGKGAIIGGLAGAAGGYIIGNEKDKKKGR